jgi:hypothetical protein
VPAEEVQALYEDIIATKPVTSTPPRGMSFQSFMLMLRQPSQDSLDIYDDRQEGSVSTIKTATHHGTSYHSEGLVSPSPSSAIGTLAGACALEAMHDISCRPSDCSTHTPSHELTTVFEKSCSLP